MNRTEKGNVILITRRAEKGNNFTNSLHTEDSPTFDSETEGQPWQKGGKGFHRIHLIVQD